MKIQKTIKIVCIKKIAPVILLTFPLLSFAQTQIINPGLVYPDSPYVYIGVPNTLKITDTSKNLKLTVDNGSISRGTDKNEYTATFSSPGIANVITRENGKFVYRKKYIIRYINDPGVLFAGRADSMLSVREMQASPCLSISIPGCYINYRFSIISFEAALIYRQGDTLNTGNGKNWCMNDEQAALLRKLRPGNKILLRNIKVTAPGALNRTLGEKIIIIKP